VKHAVTPATSSILKVSSSQAVDQKVYLSRVMKLMYLATKSRPDILCSVSFLASRSAAPTEHDMSGVDRVYSYLRGAKDFRLKISCGDMVLSASVDASFNIHRENSAGHTGMLFMISGSPIFFRSVKQKCQATSATHAEILAMFEAVTFIAWFRGLLADLGFPQRSPTVVEQDNQPSLQIYGNGWSHSNKTRHIMPKYQYVIEGVKEGLIQLKYTPSKSVKADFLTKPISGTAFRESFVDYLVG
jgi:hypothetical protein